MWFEANEKVWLKKVILHFFDSSDFILNDGLLPNKKQLGSREFF